MDRSLYTWRYVSNSVVHEELVAYSVQVTCRILRQMAAENQGDPGLNYAAFKKRLDDEGFSDKQNGPLKLRLDLLESFMELTPTSRSTSVQPVRPDFPHTRKGKAAESKWEREQDKNRQGDQFSPGFWSLEPGTLTIVDLSCPFVDEGTACALFDICLALFLEKRGDVGRIVALDEAHKVCKALTLVKQG